MYELVLYYNGNDQDHSVGIWESKGEITIQTNWKFDKEDIALLKKKILEGIDYEEQGEILTKEEMEEIQKQEEMKMIIEEI